MKRLEITIGTAVCNALENGVFISDWGTHEKMLKFNQDDDFATLLSGDDGAYWAYWLINSRYSITHSEIFDEFRSDCCLAAFRDMFDLEIPNHWWNDKSHEPIRLQDILVSEKYIPGEIAAILTWHTRSDHPNEGGLVINS